MPISPIAISSLWIENSYSFSRRAPSNPTIYAMIVVRSMIVNSVVGTGVTVCRVMMIFMVSLVRMMMFFLE